MAHPAKKPRETRISTTVRMRESVKSALEKEAEATGEFEAAIFEHALVKHLRSRGHKGLKLRAIT